MKQIKIIFLTLVFVVSVLEANIFDNLKQKTKNIGKKTPINIKVYAKNPSTVCSLNIVNVSNPYGRDITIDKLPPIRLDKGRYYQADMRHILKGSYEFEYTWKSDGQFVDSRLKKVRIFSYHDTRNKVHKKVNLAFLLKVPKACK